MATVFSAQDFALLSLVDMPLEYRLNRDVFGPFRLCYSQVIHVRFTGVNCKTHPRKATQAVARLIQKSGGKIEYLRLAKLSYLSDRESLLKRGIPITGGRYFSMNKGPVISEILDFVLRRNAPGWKETISPNRANILTLEGEPSFDALSKRELEILDAVVARHERMTTEELVQWCHDNCAEIEDVPIGRRQGIAIESIFVAEHVSTERITAVVSELESLEKLDALLT